MIIITTIIMIVTIIIIIIINDITMSGPAAVVAADVALVKAQGTPLGLVLN